MDSRRGFVFVEEVGFEDFFDGLLAGEASLVEKISGKIVFCPEKIVGGVFDPDLNVFNWRQICHKE